jgi:hypothetical protein
MYCVKCKQITDTADTQTVTVKNGRMMKRGKCAVCGKIKTQFVKNGGSILNSVINKLPFELHLPGHNFTGPGTRLDKRLNADETPKDWSMPVNRVDNASYHHDLCYAKNQDTKTRNQVCDKTMLGELEGIVNPSLRERLDRAIVEKIINTKVNFGLGILKKAPNGQTT